MFDTNDSDSAKRDADEARSKPRKSRVQERVMVIVRATLAIFGVILIPAGMIIGFLTPFIPIGLPIVIVGVVLLARNAVWGRRFVQNTLRRHPTLERFAPGWLLTLIFGDQTSES